MTPLQETKISIAELVMLYIDAFANALTEYQRRNAVLVELQFKGDSATGAAKKAATAAGHEACLCADNLLRAFKAYRDITGLAPLDACLDLQAVCVWLCEKGREYERLHPMPSTREELADFLGGLAARLAAQWDGEAVAEGRCHAGFISPPDVRTAHNEAYEFWRTWRANWRAFLESL